MIRYQESTISAYHNYLVNDMLTPGFSIGDPNSKEGFFFLADMVQSGEPVPRISARILDDHGVSLIELYENEIRKNPGGCIRQPPSGGESLILLFSGAPLLEVNTRGFANGYLTIIKTRLFDENGELRMESQGKSIRVYGDANLTLCTPFASSQESSPSK